ncbi:MAG: hypothetical protein AAF547_07660 [Actinomycetota bacterium]
MIDFETAERLAFDEVVAFVTERDLLIVSGPDAESYLQGQLSQDVAGLAVGGTAWTLLLQPQGKVDAWLRVHRAAADRFLLDTETGFGSAAAARLERFKLRVDVTIVTVTAPALALRGPGSVEAATSAAAGVLALDATWGGLAGVDLLPAPGEDGAVTEPTDGWLDDAVPEGPSAVLEAVRVRQGRPAMGTELGESTIPAAAGVVDQSVDFTKGCYVGQELVARIDSRGNNTPTRLHSLRVDGAGDEAEVDPADLVGAELTVDGGAAGTVTSVARSPSLGVVGLVYLRRSFEAPVRGEVTDRSGRTRPVAVEALPASS